MSRPIPADGTSRYSTGRPGREKAPAVAEPPTTPIRAGNTAATRAAIVSRRAQAPRTLPTKVMLLRIPSVDCAPRIRGSPGLRARVVNHISQKFLSSERVLPGWTLFGDSRDQVRFQRLQLRTPVRPGVVAGGRKLEGGIAAAGVAVRLLEILVALDRHRLQTGGVERLVRVGALVQRRGTA